LPHYICTKAEGELKAGKLDAAEADGNEALTVAVSVGNKRAAAGAQILLADINAARGQQSEGEVRLQEAAANYRTLGAKAELGDTYMRLSKLAAARGDARGAQKYSDLAYKATRNTSGLVER
jgi:hypothetical protein